MCLVDLRSTSSETHEELEFEYRDFCADWDTILKYDHNYDLDHMRISGIEPLVCDQRTYI